MATITFAGVDLHTLLSQRSVAELRKLAAGFYIKGVSKKKKAELIAEITLALQEPERLRELLLVIDKDTWSLFKTAATTGHATVAEMAYPQYRVLESLCYIYCAKYDSGSIIYLPQEVRDVFTELCEDGFLQQKERYDLLHMFVQSAINLYGIIEQGAFVDLFNHYNEVHTSVDELFPCMIRHIAVDASYCLWEEYIVSDEFEENEFEDVKDLILQIGDKPRFIPEREEFLRYSDFNYFERNSHIESLQKFLISKLSVSPPVADEIVTEVQYACAIEAPTQAILDILDEYNVPVRQNLFHELGQNIINVSNNTRLWSNNGHTPNELYQQMMPRVGKKKICRNDPCPCGSGKKYKKCYGR
mgnify:CR=1 FL=1|jgi:hypothetical protein